MRAIHRLKTRLEANAAGPDGISVRMRTARSLNLRVLPTAALDAAFRPDLDVIGGWLSASKPQVGFVQIGAYDGQTNDPIHELVRRFGWRGVLVEPQPDAFAHLVETYAGIDGLVLLNAAVSDQPGTTTLWRLADVRPSDPWWVPQAASFSREHLMMHIHGYPELAARIVGETVQAVTIDDVFARAPVPVDVLQVDAEGYDGKIIAMLDLANHPPIVVRFEHRHLSDGEHAEAIARLVGHGYRIALSEDDTIAVRQVRRAGATATA